MNRKNILDSTFAYLQVYYIIPKGVAHMKYSRYESQITHSEITAKTDFVEQTENPWNILTQERTCEISKNISRDK